MAQESFIQVNEGTGKKIHHYQRDIGASTVEEVVAVLGEPYLATYAAEVASVGLDTNNEHLIQVVAGALPLYVRRIEVQQGALAAAAGSSRLEVRRLSTVGTGGTAVTIAKYDNGDPAAAASASTRPTSKGTEGSAIVMRRIGLTNTNPVGPANKITWEPVVNGKTIIVPAGGAIVVKLAAGNDASASVMIDFVWSEVPF